MKRLKGLLCAFYVIISALPVLASQERDSLFRLIGSTSDLKKVSQLYYELCQFYRNRNVDSCYIAAQKCLQISVKANFQEGIAKGYIGMAMALEVKGELDKASFYLDSSRAYLKKLNDPKLTFNREFAVGNIYRRKGKYALALNQYTSCVRMARKSKNDTLVSRAYNAIGVTYVTLGNLKLAEEFHLMALALRLKIGDPKLLEISYENLGIVNREKKNYDRALFYYFKAIKLIPTDDSSGVAFAYNDIGAAYSLKNETKKASFYLRQSIRIRENINELEELAYTYNYLGENYERAGNLTSAEQNIKKAYAIAAKIGNNKQRVEALQSLSDFYARNKMIDSAFSYIQKHNRLKDSLLEQDSRLLTAELTTKYETEKKEKALALSKMEIVRKNNFILFVVSGFVVFLIAAIAFFRNTRVKQKKLKAENELKLKLAEAEVRTKLQEEKLRISRELHDNIGSQLTFIHSSIQNLKNVTIADQADRLEETSKLTSSTIRELRQTVWLINHSDISFEEFIVKLREYLRPLQASLPEIGIETNVARHFTLSSPVATNLFRVIQEAINNALKYAEASRIELEVVFNDEGLLQFSITDNGKGFNQENVIEGFGIRNMRTRIEQMNGNLDVRSVPGSGSVIAFNLSL